MGVCDGPIRSKSSDRFSSTVTIITFRKDNLTTPNSRFGGQQEHPLLRNHERSTMSLMAYFPRASDAGFRNCKHY